MRILYVTVALTAVAGPACAADVTLKPLAEARVRYEHVEQDGLAQDADALTLRARAGIEAATGHWSALVEAQGTLAAVDDYFDGLTGTPSRPLVADPENIALYRAQLRYAAGPATITAGRQKIALDDERFIGNVGFRQNAQTFDAVRAELAPAKGLKIDVSYAWSVRTIWGIDGAGARQQAIGGDNIFANISHMTALGTFTGFAYLIDQDEAAVQGFRLSSQTYGIRYAGSHALSPNAKLAVLLSYARQSDHHRNPNDYRADYWLADATLALGGWKLSGGYEVLGADKGGALTSFQTPLGTNFKYQGWADKFLTTPPDGVRDLYAGVGHGWKALGSFSAVTVSAAYHRFESDRNVRRYGDEIDLLASGKIGRTTLSVRYADYQAKTFVTDTQKLWLQLDWAL